MSKQNRGGEEDDDEITVVEMEDVQRGEREDLDGLTMEELRLASPEDWCFFHVLFLGLCCKISRTFRDRSRQI